MIPERNKKVEIYTDGSCSSNPGPGGWACIMSACDAEKEFSGYEPATTNNRMEITAAIKGIETLKYPCEVTIYSDSQYLCNTFNKGWIANWVKNGWINAQKIPVVNRDLWETLLKLSYTHKLTFIWVKGHNVCEKNNRCDKLAKQAIPKSESNNG